MLRALFSGYRRQQLDKTPDHPSKNEEKAELCNELDTNIETVKTLLHQAADLLIRQCKLGGTGQNCAIVCIDGLVDIELINDKVIKRILSNQSFQDTNIPLSEIPTYLNDHVLSTEAIHIVNTLDDVMLPILSGDTAVFIDGTTQVIIIGTKKWEDRSVEEPTTETLVRGPRDGFNENLRTNTVLIRRRVRDSNLRFDSFKIGRRSKKDLVLTYIDGIINPKIIEEMKRRLKTIDVDDAPESGYIEQLIEDSYLSIFPQHMVTERPDKVSSAIMQGKAAILLDGTPFALIAPSVFSDHFQSPGDYYQRFPIGTFIRALRYLAAFLAVFLPGLYIALVSYHPGMIPSNLAFQIAATREGVPFPAVVEAFLMEATFELLREAGIRLPKMIGQTIGIVGGLVIGEAAVSAGIVSPIMVIIVAVTAVSTFAIPSYEVSITFRILRFGIMLAAALFGFYGLLLAYIMINIHLTNLTSYGVPYTAPFAPAFFPDWKDLIIRAPLAMETKRPEMLQPKDSRRTGGDDTN
ncbi:spore germination protein [Cytobacillus suaedae]|nr:spore germination protein [Cytobacillus suaedae]